MNGVRGDGEGGVRVEGLRNDPNSSSSSGGVVVGWFRTRSFTAPEENNGYAPVKVMQDGASVPVEHVLFPLYR